MDSINFDNVVTVTSGVTRPRFAGHVAVVMSVPSLWLVDTSATWQRPSICRTNIAHLPRQALICRCSRCTNKGFMLCTFCFLPNIHISPVCVFR